MVIKRSLRILLIALFLFPAAVITLCFRSIVSGAGVEIFAISETVSTQQVNAALLTFAAADSAENSLRQNVEHLLSMDFKSDKHNRKRSFLSADRYRFEIGARSPELQRNLRNWWRRHRDVMSNMVNELTPANMSRYRTCVVVGNSGILLKSNQGEEIDSHEFVIRLNNARTVGYGRFVGSKTNLSFINSNVLHLCSRREGCFCQPYGEKVPIMIYISQPIHFLDYVRCNSWHKSRLMITDPKHDILCARIVKYYSVKRFLKETGKRLEEWASVHGGIEFHYSSGMQAIMLALGVCDKVSIYGFGKSDSARHHYHTNQLTELGLHDYQAEYDLYEDLVKSPQDIPFVLDKFVFPIVTIHR